MSRHLATFCVEEWETGKYSLYADDGQGNLYCLAEFHSRATVDLFNETLALAKAAAHAHGQGGI